MWKTAVAATLVALLVPGLAGAQQQPPGGGPPQGGPPPEMREKLDAARSAAKTKAFAALSDDHRAKVQAIVDRFDADGSTLTLKDAAAQIDAVLTPAESGAALDQQQQFRAAMRAAFDAGGGPGGMQANGGAPGGMRGNGGGPNGGGPSGGGPNGLAQRAPDAGRFLLSVDADQATYRAAMRAERGNGDGPPAGGPPPQ